MPVTLFDEYNDALSVDLHAQMTELPPVAQAVSTLLQWQMKGIATVRFRLEYKGGMLELVPSAPRGGVMHVQSRPGDRFIDLDAIHVPLRDSVMADEALGRTVGLNTQTTGQAIVEEKMLQMRGSLDATAAAHMLGALKGQILDADSSLLVDLYAQFGVVQQVQDFALDDPATNVLNATVAAQRKSRSALDGMQPADGYVVLCSAGFIDAMRASPSYAELSGLARPRSALEGGGFDIDRSTYVELDCPDGLSSHLGIADGEALMCPKVPGLYLTRCAPADRTDAVGQIGVPYYVVAEPMPMKRGWTIEAQTNNIHMVSRPRAVVRLTA